VKSLDAVTHWPRKQSRSGQIIDIVTQVSRSASIAMHGKQQLGCILRAVTVPDVAGEHLDDPLR
jgi:hypothetical protein